MTGDYKDGARDAKIERLEKDVQDLANALADLRGDVNKRLTSTRVAGLSIITVLTGSLVAVLQWLVSK